MREEFKTTICQMRLLRQLPPGAVPHDRHLDEFSQGLPSNAANARCAGVINITRVCVRVGASQNVETLRVLPKTKPSRYEVIYALVEGNHSARHVEEFTLLPDDKGP